MTNESYDVVVIGGAGRRCGGDPRGATGAARGLRRKGADAGRYLSLRRRHPVEGAAPVLTSVRRGERMPREHGVKVEGVGSDRGDAGRWQGGRPCRRCPRGEVSQDAAGRVRGNATRGNTVSSASSACSRSKAAGSAPRPSRPAASPRPTRFAAKAGCYIRVFPHKSVTAIPAETRMGKGKGEPEYWAAVVKPGMILFEIAGLPEAAARDCLARWPTRCRSAAAS